MDRLMVYRGQLELIPTDGEVIEYGELPEFLKQPLVADRRYLGTRLSDPRHIILIPSEDILFRPRDGYNGGILGVWSGQRSALVRDPLTKKLYRIKGIAFDENPEIENQGDTTYVVGGQFLRYALNEIEYSRKFNKILRQHGLTPVMEPVGLYKFKRRAKRRKLGAVVSNVIGDTRLDELFFAIENLYIDYVSLQGRNEKIEEQLKHFYVYFGIVAGAHKKLMNINNFTWSADAQLANAHIGNIVVYPSRRDNSLDIGFVDFDSSCGPSDSIDISKQIKNERNYMVNTSLHSTGMSLGFEDDQNLDFRLDFRMLFAGGFMQGYREYRKRTPLQPTLVGSLYRLHLLILDLLEPQIRKLREEHPEVKMGVSDEQS